MRRLTDYWLRQALALCGLSFSAKPFLIHACNDMFNPFSCQPEFKGLHKSYPANLPDVFQGPTIEYQQKIIEPYTPVRNKSQKVSWVFFWVEGTVSVIYFAGRSIAKLVTNHLTNILVDHPAWDDATVRGMGSCHAETAALSGWVFYVSICAWRPSCSSFSRRSRAVFDHYVLFRSFVNGSLCGEY